jgi:exosortase/archaeosortase family protein
MRSMFFLFGLAIFFLVLFPPPGRLRKLIALPTAVAIAFVVNAFRVALLIILVSESKRAAFEYWHLGEGALVFESASVVIFVVLYRFLLLDRNPEQPVAGGSHPNAALE